MLESPSASSYPWFDEASLAGLNAFALVSSCHGRLRRYLVRSTTRYSSNGTAGTLPFEAVSLWWWYRQYYDLLTRQIDAMSNEPSPSCCVKSLKSPFDAGLERLCRRKRPESNAVSQPARRPHVAIGLAIGSVYIKKELVRGRHGSSLDSDDITTVELIHFTWIPIRRRGVLDGLIHSQEQA